MVRCYLRAAMPQRNARRRLRGLPAASHANGPADTRTTGRIEAVSTVLPIITAVVGAIAGSAATALFGRIHRRPDGKCRRHKVQAEYKGFRLGATEPNWHCGHGGGHYVNKQGREYEPTTEKAAAVGLLAAGIVLLASLWKRS